MPSAATAGTRLKATLELNAPNYARAILSTKQLLRSIENVNA
jgi:hypothetical protein